MSPDYFELNYETRTCMCPVLLDFLPPAANCRAAGTARGPDRRQGESTAHAHCHFIWDSSCKWLAPSLRELSSLIIHWHLDVSKKSCMFLWAMSPSNLANVLSFFSTVLFISNMLKHVFSSLHMDQRLPGWDCKYIWGFAAICSWNLILIPVYISDPSFPVSSKTFRSQSSSKICIGDYHSVLTTKIRLQQKGEVFT